MLMFRYKTWKVRTSPSPASSFLCILQLAGCCFLQSCLLSSFTPFPPMHTVFHTAWQTCGGRFYYYKNIDLSRLGNRCCPGFPTGNASPGQKGVPFCPGSDNRDKRSFFFMFFFSQFFFYFNYTFAFQLNLCIGIQCV